MNLWLRLIWLLASAGRRGPLRLPDDVSVLTFRVWLHDLDISAHMNNGRYLTLMDLGRTDIMLRSGLWRDVWKNKWTPIASAISISFRREMRILQKFRLETRLVCWDATLVVMEQVFTLDGGPRDGQVAARALFKGGCMTAAAGLSFPFPNSCKRLASMLQARSRRRMLPHF
jgi:acyl-CoA thioesterase FadM